MYDVPTTATINISFLIPFEDNRWAIETIENVNEDLKVEPCLCFSIKRESFKSFLLVFHVPICSFGVHFQINMCLACC